jgi:hypothetical protein
MMSLPQGVFRSPIIEASHLPLVFRFSLPAMVNLVSIVQHKIGAHQALTHSGSGSFSR